MPALRRLTFVRHAMPEVDSASPPSAWPLSDAGVAAAAAMVLEVDAGTIVVSSPERKARQTAALAVGSSIAQIPTDPRLREVDRVERVHDGFRAARAAWVAGDLDDRHAGWEPPDAAAQRFHDGLLAHAAEHLIVGTHGMVLTAWMVAQRQVPPGDAAVTFWNALQFPDIVEISAPLLRVRAVLSDAEGRFVLIKRTRAGQEPYWTTPGGGVEPMDASPADALRRELREELGAEAVIGEILHERQLDGIRSEIFCAARLVSMDSSLRHGPELTDRSRGRYEIERVCPGDLPGLDLRPAELQDLLLRS
ncbi:NUDIX domain-containing protein [Microbacterium sp. Mu-80]|uniref:NUDIX domain-containing protein n=1 Tax=Microbacterium bandirmense TaxID=3122050 RepID=A0ABU8L883_9MICO